MKPKQFTGFCLLALLALASCKKGSKPTIKPDVNIDSGVVVSGNSSSGATIWKNGIATHLSGLPNGSFTTSIGMAVSGSDVYVAGFASNTPQGPITTAVYWENGKITPLDAGQVDAAAAYAIVLSGTDVYVAGDVQKQGVGSGTYAAYWKNGVITNLLDPTVYIGSTASGIAVSGTDVYVCGSIGKAYGTHDEAVYWKNGVLHEITDGSIPGWATSIAVQNNNVYITYELVTSNGAQSYYWENGVSTFLLNDLTFSYTNSIIVNGTDVYIAGYTAYNLASASYLVANYWKNNTLQKLPGSGQAGSANAITVSGNDVYAAGNTDSGAKYWKNGVAVSLGDATSSANGIAVMH